MPKNAYQKRVSVTADFGEDGATQYIPIIGSHEYTRFTVSVDFAGAGNVSLLGALSGDATQPDSDVPAANGDGYVLIKNAEGDSILEGAGSGLHTFKMETFMGGGIMLKFLLLDDDVTINVQMMGNVFGHNISRGV